MVQSRKWLLQRAFCKIHVCLLVDKNSYLRQVKSDTSIYALDPQKVPKDPKPHPVSLRSEVRLMSWVQTWASVFSCALVGGYTSKSSYGFPLKGRFSSRVVWVQSACPHGNTSPHLHFSDPGLSSFRGHNGCANKTNQGPSHVLLLQWPRSSETIRQYEYKWKPKGAFYFPRDDS